ncbi:1,2-phenylacetyl-CoA epoxidase subunit PaaA [Natronobiforma cellulositropha]|uniref:1,2-phenylacetyl-CoA epoxidase subunit PaaA n=1 Tax=Natronobiforma cellulositropha TaxID=1679076 RepID=UPI0021D5A12A|nr:1,2-phenylacetyl-CoA epoxidase subunit PaaA [Natronobiforma cellulositropha]
MKLEERIAAGQLIESGDELTDEYRELLCGIIQFTANSEFMGAFAESEWIPRAPSYQRKLALIAKNQDEIGHAQMQYQLAEDLGRDREQMLTSLLAGENGFGNAFHYPADEWIDIGLLAWMLDGAAMQLQHSLMKTSYGPYARIMKRVCREEEFHIRHGEHIVREYATGSREKQERLQAGVDRWWSRAVMFFGLSDSRSEKSERMDELGIKPKTNDELRQQYFDTYVPKLRNYGIDIPDENLYYDEETEQWEYTPPDWEEFNRIVTEGGPETQARLDRRRTAFEETAWVRDALEAYDGTTANRFANNITA